MKGFLSPGTKQTVRNIKRVSVERGSTVYLFYPYLFPFRINIIPPSPPKNMATRECPLKRTEGPFIRGKIRRVLHKPRLILDEMCRLYGKFASDLRRVLCKTRLILPRINNPSISRVWSYFVVNVGPLQTLELEKLFVFGLVALISI